MKIIRPYVQLEDEIDGDKILSMIEKAGRTCYKSEDRITNDSAKEFIRMLVKRGHLSVIEHQSISVRFICDRGVTHELVRHRISSFSQESTRFVIYKNVVFILPLWIEDFPEELMNKEREFGFISTAGLPHQLTTSGFDNLAFPVSEETMLWINSCIHAEDYYLRLLSLGWTAQKARAVLPNCLKTEIVMTCNLRQWREVFRQRTAKAAHPQMREVMDRVLTLFKAAIPIVFEDL